MIKYRQLANEWRVDILSGRWGPQSELPNERDLAAAHHVSRPTVRAALNILEMSGLVRREQGRGTFVATGNDSQQTGILHFVVSIPDGTTVSNDLVIPAIATEIAAIRNRRSGGIAVVPVFSGDDHLDKLYACGYPGLCRNGVVFHGIRMPDDAALRRLARDRVPCILIGRPIGTVDAPHVHADHRSTGQMAARHLLAHGHRKIALLDGPWGHLPCAQRRDGFLEEMLAAGAAPIVIDAIGWDRAFTARSARRALADTAARPTAVVIYGDRGTAGLFDVVLEMGIEVPRDLAVIAVDIPNSALDAAPVPLTAFVPDYTGYAIAIDDALTNHKSGSIVVPDRFVVGRTCGCVPIRHDLDLMNAQSFSLAIP